MLYSRCGSDWRKEDALTWGGLTSLERIDEKSAEAIVGFGNELPENGGGLIRQLAERVERMSCSKCCEEAFCGSGI